MEFRRAHLRNLQGLTKNLFDSATWASPNLDESIHRPDTAAEVDLQSDGDIFVTNDVDLEKTTTPWEVTSFALST